MSLLFETRFWLWEFVTDTCAFSIPLIGDISITYRKCKKSISKNYGINSTGSWGEFSNLIYIHVLSFMKNKLYKPATTDRSTSYELSPSAVILSRPFRFVRLEVGQTRRIWNNVDLDRGINSVSSQYAR